MDLYTTCNGLSHNLMELLSEQPESYDNLFINSISKNEIDVVKYLIDQNFPIKSLDKCFNIIIYHRNLEMIEIFIKSGFIINPELGKTFFDGRTYLCREKRSLHLAKFLFESGININYDYDYMKMYGSDENIELLDYLMTNNIINESSMNLIYKSDICSLNFIKMLFKHNPSMNLDPYLTKVISLTENDDDDIDLTVEIIKFLISSGANPNNEKAIRICYINGKYKLLKLLLDNGARADSISLLDLPIVKLLYDYGGQI